MARTGLTQMNRSLIRGSGGALLRAIQGGAAGARASLPIVGNRLLSEIQGELSKSGSGRTYERSNPSRTHQASSPGSPPARDLGNYLNSWSMQVSANSLAVGTSSPIGPILEFGSSKMAARPHLRTAVSNVTGEVTSTMAAGYVAGQRGQVTSQRAGLGVRLGRVR